VTHADETFRAVSHPVRRAILDSLARGERTAGELCGLFDVSQPAVSQHLAVLREAGLVRARREGKQQVYELVAGPLREVYDWAGHYERFWSSRLDALGQLLDREAKKGKRS
jgi:DNA-binding transcriptional ArsR family regulator